MENAKVKVSERALVQRISRSLAHEGLALKAARGARAQDELGRWYVIDVSHNFVVEKDVDLEELAKRIGVLKPYEVLAED